MRQLKRAAIQTFHFEAGAANTGLTWTVTRAKNSSAFGAASSTVGELSGGVYYVVTSVSDTSDAGSLMFRFVSGGVTVNVPCQVGLLDDIANAIALVDSKLGDNNTDLADEIAAVQLDTAALLLKADPVLQFAEINQITNQVKEVRRGDSYTGTIRNPKFTWTVRTYTDISAATAYWTCKTNDLVTQKWSKSCTPEQLEEHDDGTYTFELAFDLLASESDDVTAAEKPPKWDVTIELGADRDTPYSGIIKVIEQVKA